MTYNPNGGELKLLTVFRKNGLGISISCLFLGDTVIILVQTCLRWQFLDMSITTEVIKCNIIVFNYFGQT